ncbi:unnamed protein product [Phyllotreta striolata]|uniref:CRAL-TRIO domain-containing protein n=1 Tax=Phyllotreta striolata TaxID=444603 RepID=A0A9N9TH85_PHYSR|nr:unnamed protein product [Phyllotreta striolata]
MSLENILVVDRESVRRAWGKTDADVKEYLEIIKEWLKTQHHLPEMPGDNMIEFFLTNCKYSVEKTKGNLDMYYTMRNLMPSMYRNMHPCKPQEIQPALNTGMIAVLPKLTQDLYRITVLKYKKFDDVSYDMTKFMAHCLNNLFEIRIHEDLTMGEIFIISHEHADLNVLSKLTPVLLKNIAQILEKVHCNRMKALHLLNPPAYVDTIISIFKRFLPKNLQERIFFHKTLEDLHKHVPRELLPGDYGGKEKPLQELSDLWMRKLEQYKDRFDKLEKMKIDESLRPEKLENDDILGYHGNFKKLNVD